MRKTISDFCFLSSVVCLSVFCFLPSAYANNLSITNGYIASQDSTNDTAVIQFDISQDNSWRDAVNYDAVWVFVKYSTDGTTWHHATLSASGTNPAGFDTGVDGDTSSGTDKDNIEIKVPADKVGCFIQRSENEAGTLDRDNIQITWDYGVDGVSDSSFTTTGGLTFKIFGIEMVYIPEGSFYAGDGTDEASNAEFDQGSAPAEDDPWYIESEDAISVTNVDNDGYYYNSGGNTGEDAAGSDFIIPASFPKGYHAFYLMKYELTQGQYRDFLNTLTQAQQDTRTETTLSSEGASGYFVMSNGTSISYRQTIKAGPDPSDGEPYTFGCDYDDDEVLNEPGDGEWIAMNYIRWMDLAAFADWAGLRPMTELEFEKACRGKDIYPVVGEYAWGTTGIASSAYTLSNSAASNEGIATNYSTTNGNCSYNTTDGDINGSLRAGIFSANGSNSGRVTSGAGYYGNMELSGNNWERVVTVGNATGRSFLGTNGNGELSSNGNADISDWPGSSSGEVTGATGSGFRGGSWGSFTHYTRVSDRGNAAHTFTSRGSGYGGRVCRQGF